MADIRTKLVAYWLYLWALICIIFIYEADDIFEIALSIFLAALYYQAGTGLLKSNPRDRMIALILLTLAALGDVAVILYGLAFDSLESLPYVGLSFCILAVSSYCVYWLRSDEVRRQFGIENQT